MHTSGFNIERDGWDSDPHHIGDVTRALFKVRQEYTSKVAKTEKGACELIEAGSD